MKKTLILIGFILLTGYCRAQNSEASQTQAALAEKPTPPLPIPSFSIITADSTKFTQANIKKDKPVMIIYFGADCTHCQHLMLELKPKLDELKNVQIVMITWSMNYDIRPIKQFRADYDLKKYPNIILGSEGYTYKVQGYYNVRTTPFIAMYNSGGKWVKYFDKVPKAADVLEAATKLK